MNEQTERASLISRLMSIGVFKNRDRHTMRTMSLNTLRELTRVVRADRLPELKRNVVGGIDRNALIERLLSSGNFQPEDKNALWLLSFETLKKLAGGAKANSDHSVRAMVPPSLGDIIRGR